MKPQRRHIIERHGIKNPCAELVQLSGDCLCLFLSVAEQCHHGISLICTRAIRSAGISVIEMWQPTGSAELLPAVATVETRTAGSVFVGSSNPIVSMVILPPRPS